MFKGERGGGGEYPLQCPVQYSAVWLVGVIFEAKMDTRFVTPNYFKTPIPKSHFHASQSLRKFQNVIFLLIRSCNSRLPKLQAWKVHIDVKTLF